MPEWQIDLADVTLTYLARLNDEVLRRQGRLLSVVQHQLARGEQPAKEDLEAVLMNCATRQIPLPPDVATCIACSLGRRSKRGRKAARSPLDDLKVVAIYYAALSKDSNNSHAIEQTAKQL